ncbi:general substrate transporter [Lipomyces arxii]|uniref:general substrate transporter n=1 Tax=Lipomyces arxii TaxID=56418 RepID=UPI0034CD5854
MFHLFFKSGSLGPSILIAAYAAVGGLMYGHSTGLIAGLLAMDPFKHHYGAVSEEDGAYYLPSGTKALFVSVLSIGQFCGAFSTGYLADLRGRRLALIFGSLLFMFAVAMQVATPSTVVLAIGRFIAGFAVGAICSIGPMYQAEIAPRNLRGTITAGFHSAKTIGILLVAIINNATKDIDGSAAYLIPTYLQLMWPICLIAGFAFLPESPRYYMKCNKREKARQALSVIRHREVDDPLISTELDEIEFSLELEQSFGDATFKDCFKKENRQLFRLIVGLVMGAFSQLVGVNFIKFFGTDFFQQAGLSNSFIISIAIDLVSVVMTIPALYFVERFGRRRFLIAGSFLCGVIQFTISIAALTTSPNTAQKILISFCILYIAVESISVGPTILVVIGETFSLRTRAKSIALSIGFDFFWSFAIAIGTPYLVDPGPGSADLGSNVFFIWGSSCLAASLYMYFCLYETKALTLEQIDELYLTVPYAWQPMSFVPRDENLESDTILELNGKRHSNTDMNATEIGNAAFETQEEFSIEEITEDIIQEHQVWSNI